MDAKHLWLEPLTKELIASRISEFVEMSQQLQGDYWTLGHYLGELNRKWELSRAILDDDGRRMRAFSIVSQKPESLHVHRIAVAKEDHNKGLGKALMQLTIRDARNMNVGAITLKAEADNAQSLGFYKKLGFEITGEQGVLVLMQLNVAQ